MPEPVAVLREVRRLLADPARWTQHVDAVNAADQRCDPRAPEAVQWCILGACIRTLGTDDVGPMSPIVGLLGRAARETAGLRLTTTVNDRLGHAAVLAMLDKAIAIAEAEAACGT